MELRPDSQEGANAPVSDPWEVVSLDSCVRPDAPICYGILMPGADTHGGVPVVKVRDIGDGRVYEENLLRTHPSIDQAYARSRLKGGDVLITIRGTTGRIALVSQRLNGANITQDTARVRIKVDVDAEFIYYALQSEALQHQIALQTIGQAVKGINIRDVRELALARPRSSPEQRAIAAALSDVDALLDGLARLIAKKRDLKQAAMQQLLTGQTRLPGFVGEWEETRLDEIVAIRNAKTVAQSTERGTRCVELESIAQGTGRLLGTIAARGASPKYTFKKGDVLFGRLRAYLMKFWYATFDGVCSTEIWPLLPRDNRLTSGYLHLLVQTSDFLEAAGVSYGTHMPRSD